MEDKFIFFENENNAKPESTERWNILVIDDDMDVHVMTTLSLKNIRIHGRGLNIAHAYSGVEAIAYLKTTMEEGAEATNVDLILLDMVMETKYAGLDVARWLREDGGKHETPIVILRTGQPGLLTKEEILTNDHFHGMIEKTSVTYHNLVNLLNQTLSQKKSLVRRANHS